MIYASLYREFVNTKETNNWDDSYEVSEHNAEDSTGSRSVAGSGSLPRVSQDADKENVPLPGHHERSVTDSTLNLQTSVDVTMLPGEPRISSSRNANNTTSICLSSEERRALQSSLYDHRAMDKTYDLMSQSLITRIQSQTSNFEDPSFEQPPIERVKSVNTPVAKGISLDHWRGEVLESLHARPRGHGAKARRRSHRSHRHHGQAAQGEGQLQGLILSFNDFETCDLLLDLVVNKINGICEGQSSFFFHFSKKVLSTPYDNLQICNVFQ